MFRFAILTAVLSSMFVVGTVEASQNRAARAEIQGARKGPVARLIELERRKNEWLRQQFGR